MRQEKKSNRFNPPKKIPDSQKNNSSSDLKGGKREKNPPYFFYSPPFPSFSSIASLSLKPNLKTFYNTPLFHSIKQHLIRLIHSNHNTTNQ